MLQKLTKPVFAFRLCENLDSTSMYLASLQAIRFERSFKPPTNFFSFKAQILIIGSSNHKLFLPNIIGFDKKIVNINIP